MSQLIMKHPDFQPENVKFDTVEVHAGEPRDPYGSLIPPIYQTSTFYFDSTDDAVEACSDYAESFAYSRITNPSLDYMEQKLAALEHGKGAVSYASGMGAVDVFLYGSYARGTATKDSDIDIAIIVRQLPDDYLRTMATLWKLTRGVSDDIEPVLLTADDDKSGFLSTVRKTGIAV